ncbi:MAG: M56 family metallopeptidase [Gemmatimonadota bacterium]|nr:M56 family metallopeptidase [Gemmatimonadota bacterium]
MITGTGLETTLGTLADAWLPRLADAALKGFLLLGVAGLATAAARRSSAATRHLVWASAVAALLVLPLLSAVLPAWKAELPLPKLAALTTPRSQPHLQPPTAAPEKLQQNGPLSPSRPETFAPNEVETQAIISINVPERTSAENGKKLSWSSVILLVWLSGVVALLTPTIVGLIRVRWLGRSSSPASADVWAVIADRLPAELCPKRAVRLLESDESSMPMTWGIVRPVVLVPARARTWPAWQRRNVLLHELAHVRRNDCLTQLLAQVACAVYWFNPLVWLAANRLRVEREHACDDQVLLAGSKASEYATHLLDVARSLRPAAVTGMASVSMARPSQLSGRLLAVLDERRSRSRVSRPTLVKLEVAVLCLVLPLAAFKPWTPNTPAAPKMDASSTPSLLRPEKRLSRMALKSPAPEGRAALPANELRSSPLSAAFTESTASAMAHGGTSMSPFAPSIGRVDVPVVRAPLGALVCSGRGKDGNSSHSSNSTHDDGTRLRTWMANFWSDGCSYRVNALGEVAFNRDATDVTKIERGGYFEIEERDGDTIRRVEIRPSASGELVRKYLVNGTERPYDAEASKWLADVLILVERRTGFAAESRVPALLERGGVDAVLTEISLIPSDYAKRLYYSELVKNATLNAADVQRAVRQAATEMHSDYEMAELMISMARQPAFAAGAHEAYAEGVMKIKSDYEKRRAMTALLSRDKLSKDVVRMLLESTASMHSDYELAEFLISVAKRYPPDADTRKYYLSALDHISSDYERRRVLSAVSSPAGLDDATSSAALQTAGKMSSDYEKAEMLLTVVKRGSMDAAGRADFFAAARTLKSPYDKHRVLQAVLSLRPMTRDVVVELLDVAPSIRSDYDLSELLIAIARATPIDETLRPAYMKAAESIKGEYEYGRVVAAIRNRGG